MFIPLKMVSIGIDPYPNLLPGHWSSQCHHSAQPIPAVAASPRPALANPRAAATGAGDRGCGCHVSWKNMALGVKDPAAQA